MSDTSRVLSLGTQEYTNLQEFCNRLNKDSPNKHTYVLKDIFLDFGADIMWTTIVNNTVGCQVLSPIMWEDIVYERYSLDDIEKEFFEDKWCQDKKVFSATQRDMITYLFMKAVNELIKHTECLNTPLRSNYVITEEDNVVINIICDDPAPCEYKLIRIYLDYNMCKHTANIRYLDHLGVEVSEHIRSDRITSIIHKILLLSSSGYFTDLEKYLITIEN